MEGKLLKPWVSGVLWSLPLLTLTAVLAGAQPVSGFYVQGDGGFALPQQQSLRIAPAQGSPTTSTSDAANAAINGGSGAVESGSVGLGLGQGFRVELQGMHRTVAGGTAP